MIRIAICEKDKKQQAQLLDYIAQDVDIDDDYVTECFDKIESVKNRIEQGDFKFDLLFLTVDKKGEESIKLAEYIRQMKIDVDVFFIAETIGFVTEAFRCKAFNYIVKPFEMLEVLARIEGILRRHGKLQTVIQIEDLEINTSAMTVTRDGTEIILTKKEYELLLFFVQNPGIVLYKSTIYEHVWGGEYPEKTRTVELHVQRLKKKLDWGEKIKTVHMIGYRLEGPK